MYSQLKYCLIGLGTLIVVSCGTNQISQNVSSSEDPCTKSLLSLQEFMRLNREKVFEYDSSALDYSVFYKKDPIALVQNGLPVMPKEQKEFLIQNEVRNRLNLESCLIRQEDINGTLGKAHDILKDGRWRYYIKIEEKCPCFECGGNREFEACLGMDLFWNDLADISLDTIVFFH